MPGGAPVDPGLAPLTGLAQAASTARRGRQRLDKVALSAPSVIRRLLLRRPSMASAASRSAVGGPASAIDDQGVAVLHQQMAHQAGHRNTRGSHSRAARRGSRARRCARRAARHRRRHLCGGSSSSTPRPRSACRAKSAPPKPGLRRQEPSTRFEKPHTGSRTAQEVVVQRSIKTDGVAAEAPAAPPMRMRSKTTFTRARTNGWSGDVASPPPRSSSPNPAPMIRKCASARHAAPRCACGPRSGTCRPGPGRRSGRRR